MFTGEYRHSVDDKGRLVLPSKLRKPLEKGLVVTKGQERSLYVFTQESWQAEGEQITRLPRTSVRNRNYARSFFGGASDQKLDKQGRLIIPPPLREYAGIEREVVILGVAERVEVWAASAWDEIAAEVDHGYSTLEEPLGEEGI